MPGDKLAVVKKELKRVVELLELDEHECQSTTSADLCDDVKEIRDTGSTVKFTRRSAPAAGSCAKRKITPKSEIQ